jgi:hypothetical protein
MLQSASNRSHNFKIDKVSRLNIDFASRIVNRKRGFGRAHTKICDLIGAPGIYPHSFFRLNEFHSEIVLHFLT